MNISVYIHNYNHERDDPNSHESLVLESSSFGSRVNIYYGGEFIGEYDITALCNAAEKCRTE